MKQVTIYTDGACSGNPGPGGWGAILMYGQHRRELSGGEANTTNNRMELTAVIQALSLLKEYAPDAEIDRVALSCGGGGEFFRRAHELGANVFVTGEMKHHERIEAQGLGMQVIIAGHEESERVVLEPLKVRLEALLPEKTPIFIG